MKQTHMIITDLGSKMCKNSCFLFGQNESTIYYKIYLNKHVSLLCINILSKSASTSV